LKNFFGVIPVKTLKAELHVHNPDLSGLMPKTSFLGDIRCRLLTDLYGQPFVNMKLRFPGWRASAKVCQFAAKHFLSLPPSRLLQRL
jgi:hypothetical protein